MSKNQGHLTIAFRVEGDRITFNSSSEASIKAAMQIAKELGWEKIRVRGTKSFSHEAELQAERQRLRVEGREKARDRSEGRSR